jgi:glutamate/tyrosine decarboxylase-like PLP-dependent enzyme
MPDPAGSTAQASQWPARGLSTYEIRELLLAYEKESHFDIFERNLFEEGPHLTSSPALPWGDEVRHLVDEAYLRFMHGETWHTGTGALKMEKKVISMMGEMFGNSDAVGLITSGGSESNIAALATAKARAFVKRFFRNETPSLTFDSLLEIFAKLREFEAETHGVVMPAHTHYSIYKACALLNLEPVPVMPTSESFTEIDPNDIRASISDETIALVGTAGTWPFGTIDPIAEMGEIALQRDIYFHVDACFGGFIIPFLERSGYYAPPLAPWDFRVPGVSSISADLHKNGMVPPPASSLYFRDKTLFGLAKMVAPPFGCLTGTRGTGPLAASWTMMQRLGLQGYMDVSRHSMNLRDQLIEGILAIPGMKVVSGSKINLIVAYSEEYDLRPVVGELNKLGWQVVTNAIPDPVGLCVCTMPQNDGQIEPFVADLKKQIERVAKPIGELGEMEPVGLYGNLNLEV